MSTNVNITANYIFCYAQINKYTLTTEQTTNIENDMNVSCYMPSGVDIDADKAICNCNMPSPTISTGVNVNTSAMECNCSMPNPIITTRNLLAIRKTFTLASKNLSFTG
jgi:hypothetical protein